MPSGPTGEKGIQGLPGKDGLNGKSGEKGDKGDACVNGQPGKMKNIDSLDRVWILFQKLLFIKRI